MAAGAAFGGSAEVRSQLREERAMSTEEKNVPSEKWWTLSLDSWAVLVALLAALLIRIGVVTRVPW